MEFQHFFSKRNRLKKLNKINKFFSSILILSILLTPFTFFPSKVVHADEGTTTPAEETSISTPESQPTQPAASPETISTTTTDQISLSSLEASSTSESALDATSTEIATTSAEVLDVQIAS